MRCTINKYFSRKYMLLLLLLPVANTVLAQSNGAVTSSINNPLVMTMVIIMLILLLAIGLLAYVLLGAAIWHRDREKEMEKKTDATVAPKVLTVLLLLLCGAPLFAQETAPVTEAVQTTTRLGGLSATAFYCMIGVIALELGVLFVLLYQLQLLLAKEKAKKPAEGGVEYKVKTYHRIWDRLNSFRPVEQEAQIDLGHEYDGIRELDNRLPPWWLYGFYLTIVVGAIYLWRYHISETAPLSIQEYQIAMQHAEEEKAAYLKRSANNVDENTVKLVTDASTLAAAQTTYQQNCAACHGKEGQGMVGPNLTDNYWIHGGNIKDIFKTIKYGVPEKGMRSWKDDLSPSQMAQVASYIKNLQGTNPPNAREKQGELYRENNTDSTTQATVGVK
jgi:cytochrome c oxidase cbb3-type subunit 3